MAVSDVRLEASRDSSLDRRASRNEKIAPPAVSLMRYAPAAVLIAILLADSNRHTDPDLWGHLRFGQVFIAGRRLLHRDTYSYSAAGHRWRDHEWLAEVVMAAVYNAAGVVGLKLWKFACTATAFLLVADTEASTGAPPTIQLAVLFAATCGFVLQAQFRAQMFSFVLLGALLALLARDNLPPRRPTVAGGSADGAVGESARRLFYRYRHAGALLRRRRAMRSCRGRGMAARGRTVAADLRCHRGHAD
jgi:hypothetical protein